MYTALKMILSLILTVSMQGAISDATEVTPEQAAAEFLDGVSVMQEETMSRYADNSYVNFLMNVEGDEKTVERMQKALLKNFSYKIVGTEERGDAAVAKVDIENCKFSGVLDDYEEESYEYVTGNLYDEDITDKEKLAEKCLDIYVSEIESRAEKGKTKASTIYIPMRSDGYNGWNIDLDDEIMKKILGNLSVPGELLKQDAK